MAFQLFVDGSCDPTSKVGYGAILCVEAADIREIDVVRREVRTNRFHPCGSSSLELLTFLWAMAELGDRAKGVTVFTDSQTMIGLPERRDDLFASDFCSRSGKVLGQASLYREFYDVMDRFEPSLVKLKGHRPKAEKTRGDLLFSLVDKASRSALRACSDLGRV